MVTQEIVLYNAEQKLYFRLLSGHQLPEFFGNLFEDPEHALNFLHAFSKLRSEKPNDRWSGTEIPAQIRQQVLKLIPDQVSKLATIATDKWVSGKMDLGTTLAVAFSSPPNDIRHAAAVIQVVNRTFLREDFYNLASGFTYVVPVVIVVTAPVTRTWSLLTEGVKRGVPEAQNAFQNFLFLLAVLGKYPHFVGPESDMYQVFDDPKGFHNLLDEMTKRLDLWSKDRHRIPVLGDTAYACNHFAKQMAKKEQAQSAKAQKLIAWFGAYEDNFQELAAKMWDEIEADTKYGLKPTGDLVTVEVKDLRNNYWRYIQLLPGKDHIHFTARVWLYLPGDVGRISVLQKMSKSRLHKVARDAGEKDYDTLCDKLQQFIALHSYWKIATGKIFRVRVKRTPGGEKQRVELEHSFQVRPHYRWLPPDHHASEQAIARSLATFQSSPPPGKTFVMSDPEEGAIKASLSTADLNKSVVHYFDEDLGYPTEN